MLTDTFDKILWVLLLLTAIALAAVVVVNRGAAESGTAGSNKALEREMAYQARVELITRLYAPVEELRRQGKAQEALLKLDGLIRKYPGEAHGYILQGEILREMGTLDEAVSSFVEGVKLNGDYVHAKSPLSRRDAVQKLANEALASVGARLAANPGNRSLAATLQKVNYLKSRLAGGCE